MVLSSHAALHSTDERTGVWLESFTGPYFEFIDHGYEVTLASPAGGKPPIDPLSQTGANTSGSLARFASDTDAQLAFDNTWKLEEVLESDFSALFYTDGHGAMYDLAYNASSAWLLLSFLNAGKPVALVGHGSAALIRAAELQPGLLADRRLTGFSDTEEALLKRHRNIPFDLSDHLKILGAAYEKGIIPFTPHVAEDGLLITGQNAASALPAARSIVKKLEGEPAEVNHS